MKAKTILMAAGFCIISIALQAQARQQTSDALLPAIEVKLVNIDSLDSKIKEEQVIIAGTTSDSAAGVVHLKADQKQCRKPSGNEGEMDECSPGAN